MSPHHVARLQAALGPDVSGTRYELRGVLGHGGTGSVYEAFDHELQRSVALKVVTLPEYDPHAEEALRREAQLIARLQHPAIVPIYDVGALPDGRLFYTMRLVDGQRLDQALISASVFERLNVFLKICEPVAFAHAHGVAHGDLKPSNIMTGPFGEVLVLDWGSAARPEVASGTPGWMAPEQKVGSATPAADIYALGRLLQFLLPEPPSALTAVIRRATSDAPAARYNTVAELAADVTRYLEGSAVLAHRESVRDTVIRLVRRHRAVLGLLSAYLVMRAAVFFFTQL